MADVEDVDSPGWGDEDAETPGWGDDDGAANTPGWGEEEGDDGWGADAVGGDVDDWGEEQDMFSAITDVDIEEEEDKGPKFAVHESAEVEDMINNNVDQLANLIQDEPKENVKLILQYYKWKPEKANERYYGEMAKARIEAGVDVDPNANEKYDTEESDCEICMEKIEPSDWLSLECGHRFCKTCWIDTLEQAARTRDCIKLTCPDDTCRLAITSGRMDALGLSAIDARKTEFFCKRVQKFTIDNFIACNNMYRYCPGVNCTRIIEMIDSTSLSIECKCGKSFCWKCSQDAHHPAPCKVSEAWEKKNAGATDDDMKWIISNSKKCPGCGYYIERNQGCNHMTCRHPNCGHEFCWMCGADWKTHGSQTGGYYKCNIYEAKKADSSIYDRERKAKLFQEELKKYRFYYERYYNHISSMKKMKEEIPVIEEKMRNLSETLGWSANEAAFIRDAATTVTKNRHLLAWTYAIGFYVDPEMPTFNLFQKWQGDLDHYTDRLHELLEKPMENYIEMEFRTELKTYAKAIAGYQKKLTVGIEEQIVPAAFPKGWKPVEITLDC